MVDIARGGNIRQLVLIHGSPLSAEFREKLKQGYDGKTFDGIVHQPREMTTVEL